jgi:hypothetical protein
MHRKKEKVVLKILAQELLKMKLWIERYGSRSFGGQNGLFRRFWGGICLIFEWLKVLA